MKQSEKDRISKLFRKLNFVAKVQLLNWSRESDDKQEKWEVYKLHKQQGFLHS